MVPVLRALDGGRSSVASLGPGADDLVVRGREAAPGPLRLVVGSSDLLRVLQRAGRLLARPQAAIVGTGVSRGSVGRPRPRQVSVGRSATAPANAWTSSSWRICEVPSTPSALARSRRFTTVVRRSSVSQTSGVLGAPPEDTGASDRPVTMSSSSASLRSVCPAQERTRSPQPRTDCNQPVHVTQTM